jgi:valyl-tRNA synthetase
MFVPFVIQIRSIRSQLNIPPSKKVPLIVEGDTHGYGLLERHMDLVKLLTRLDSISLATENIPPSAMAVLDKMNLYIPMAGLIDLDAEKARLNKELKRIEIEIGKCRGKLTSETFVANAPAAVVEQERQRLADWQAQQTALAEQLTILG